MSVAKPHGGKLVDRTTSEKKRARSIEEADNMPKLRAEPETIMDIEKIAIGAYSPLEGFLGYEDYKSVLNTMRLSDGLPWTIPIIFAPSCKENENVIRGLKEGEDVALVDGDSAIAILHLEERFDLDKRELSSKVYGTTEKSHPNVGEIENRLGNTALSGKIELINSHGGRNGYELTPTESRNIFNDRGWKMIAAYQCRNPPHGAHEYVQRCALELVDGLFIHPVVGKLKKGDYKPEIILGAYEVFISSYYRKSSVVLAPLSIAMRYAGPRAAIFLAIIRKNYGCTHFILGRDIAGVGNYYEPYAAHQLFDELELGIEPMKFQEVFYCKKCGSFASEKTCGHAPSYYLNISQTAIREGLKNGEMPPPEIVRPEVADILSKKRCFRLIAGELPRI